MEEGWQVREWSIHMAGGQTYKQDFVDYRVTREEAHLVEQVLVLYEM